MSAPRIVIVGGVAGGASAATRARRLNESAKIVMFEKGEHVSFANCGLPYHIGGQIADRGKLLIMSPAAFKATFNVDAHTRHEVTQIDREGHRVEVLDLSTGQRRWEPYDKLILSPGAAPIIPPWDGVDGPNVFSLRDVTDMDRIKAYVEDQAPRRAVVIGAGYIGLEMVEALRECGLTVALVEKEPQVLPFLDEDMARQVEKVLSDHCVELHLGAVVEDLLLKADRVGGVRFADGTDVPADLVLISIGVRPVTNLARDAGLELGERGAIRVDELLRTNDPDIYAVGDAAEVVHGVTGEPGNIPLAGPANRNGRAVGSHAATGHAPTAAPVLGTAIVGAFGIAAASTGLSVKAARKAGFDCGVAYALRGHHVGYYPGAEQMVLKLVFDRDSGRVLGAQAVGGSGVDKRIDVIATAIHFKATVDDLAGLDLAYAPQFGAAKDPVHIAAFVAQNQRDGLVKQLVPGDPPVGRQLVDVRSEAEFARGGLPGAINIPLPELRDRLNELNPDEPVMVHCGVGQRSYNACRILMQSGFSDVWNLAGGYKLNASIWPEQWAGTSPS